MKNEKEHIHPWRNFERNDIELKTKRKLIFDNSNINTSSSRASYKVVHNVED